MTVGGIASVDVGIGPTLVLVGWEVGMGVAEGMAVSGVFWAGTKTASSGGLSQYLIWVRILSTRQARRSCTGGRK